MILFLFILFHTTWEQKGFGRLPLWASVDIFQSVTVEGIRNEKWRSFWTREMREGRARECEWNAFSFYFTFLFQRLLRRLFSSWKEFLLRSLHIFVRLCKLGSNVKWAPTVYQNRTQLFERWITLYRYPVDNAIDFPKRIHWIAIYPVDSAIKRLNNQSQISTILARQKSLKHLCTSQSLCNVQMWLQSYVATTTLQKGGGNEREQNFPKCFKVFVWDCRYLMAFLRYAKKTTKHWLQVLLISTAGADLVPGYSK